MVVIVAVEGNIGVGKSTVLSNLKAHYAGDARVAFVDEPVGVWEENGLLAAMYDNSLSRCSFQLMALTTRFSSLSNTLSDNELQLVITERSIYSDRHCFARVNLEAGSADEASYRVSHDALCAAVPGENVRHATILLEAPRNTVVARINQRGRAAEQTEDAEADDEATCAVPNAYLAALDDAHSAYFEMLPPHARRRIDATVAPDAVCANVLGAIDGLMASLVPPGRTIEPPSESVAARRLDIVDLTEPPPLEDTASALDDVPSPTSIFSKVPSGGADPTPIDVPDNAKWIASPDASRRASYSLQMGSPSCR